MTDRITDPIPRTRADGVIVMPGPYVGVIYQASNALYAGRATRRTLTLLPDGTVFSNGVRAGSRILQDERRRAFQVVMAV